MKDFTNFLLIFTACFCNYWFGYYMGTRYEEPEEVLPEVVISISPKVTIGPREKVACDFDEPITHVTYINHWYDTNEEMYADYLLLTKPKDPVEIWGWSGCIWQPEDDWAACDMYLVKPTYVYDDEYVETMGHEALHGACGDFHK